MAHRKIDWDAITARYRTGKYTLRQLEAEFQVDNATIARYFKRNGIGRDLTEAVRHATRALVIEERVSKEISEKISKGQQVATDTVVVAASLDQQMVSEHHRRTAKVAQMAELATDVATTALREAGTPSEKAKAVAMAESAARTNKTVIETEDRIHGGLYQQLEKKNDDGTSIWLRLAEEDRKAREAGEAVA